MALAPTTPLASAALPAWVARDLRRPLVDGRVLADQLIDRARAAVARGVTAGELTVLAHGAGTQTSVLLALAAYTALGGALPPAGRLPLDVALFADVGDAGTPCEWPETHDFLVRLSCFVNTRLTPLRLARLAPADWNPYLHGDHSGLYDRSLARRMIPSRQLRICTDHYKVQPQLGWFRYVHDGCAAAGYTVTFRQVVGFSAGEERRAARFKASLPYITPWFPLIDWGWDRATTLRRYTELVPLAGVLGLPERSGCWFCPFQKRGHVVMKTGRAVPRSWTALRVEQPALYAQAVALEQAQAAERQARGKAPIYLYNDRPLDHWTDPLPHRTGYRQAELWSSEGEASDDDLCVSGHCLY